MNPRITIDSVQRLGTEKVDYRIDGLIYVQTSQRLDAFVIQTQPPPSVSWVSPGPSSDMDRLAAFIECLQMAHATMTIWKSAFSAVPVSATSIANVAHQLTVAEFVAEQEGVSAEG